jgi:hypothetical protein
MASMELRTRFLTDSKSAPSFAAERILEEFLCLVDLVSSFLVGAVFGLLIGRKADVSEVEPEGWLSEMDAGATSERVGPSLVVGEVD